jgi:hypothetical protein
MYPRELGNIMDQTTCTTIWNDSTPTTNGQRSRLQPPQLDQYILTQLALKPSHHTSIHKFPSFSMAPTKTTKKNTTSRSKATQDKGKKFATSTAALQTAKKNVPSKSKATQAKGKKNAASTAALQAAKKNQMRKDSSIGMSYHGLIHRNV